MPDNWKIVDAQLKVDQLNLEFDRDKGIEKQNLPLLNSIEKIDKDVQFRGTNRLNGFLFLHFPKEDPQIVVKPPLSKSRIDKGLKSHEMLVVFRKGNRLVIHFVAENTPSGNLHSHNLRQYCYGDSDNFAVSNPNLINGVLHFKFGENYKGKRNFPIQEFVEPHEKFGSGSGGGGFGESKIIWTYHYDLISKQKKD